jgi:hypothetical protein
LADRFVGAAEPLTVEGLRLAANELGCTAAAILAIIEVETAGCGFLPDRRPVTLFERHVFARETGHRYDLAHPDISNPTPGGYGPGGANQYDRIERAMQIDEPAALRSASWGLGQIMGFNYSTIGYVDTQSMIMAFCDSEDAQVLAIARFCYSKGLALSLRNRNWRHVALVYNGSAYERHDYHGRLAAAYRKHVIRKTDLQLRAKQVRMMFAGLYKGRIDGCDGPKTQAALRLEAIQSEQGSG